MNDNAPDKIPDGDRLALDALHAEISDHEQLIGENLRASLRSESVEAPPMPEDLLDDVLSDLGVTQSAATAARGSGESMFARLLSLFRANPVALGIAAAAACFVVIVAVNLDSENGNVPGRSGIRGGGATTPPQVAAPLVIVFQPSDALLETVTANFDKEYLRFPATEAEMQRLVDASERARIVVTGGAGGTITSFPAGATAAASETSSPAAADDVVDAIIDAIDVVQRELE